jgi:sec-independent protein translocase protein TatA
MLAEIFGMDGVIVVLVIGMVLFGSSQIPKLARSLGSAQKEFKHGLQEGAAKGEENPEVKPAIIVAVPSDGASSNHS